MIETVLAVLVVSFAFIVLFRLSYMLVGKVLLEHAAMRVARARSVGFNDFMCRKVARVALIPVSGKRLWPTGDDAIDWNMELSRIPIYMSTMSESIARGVFEYDGWNHLSVDPGDGTATKVSQGFSLFDDTEAFRLDGTAGIENNASLYMHDNGL
jgi:hypothetical protein